MTEQTADLGGILEQLYAALSERGRKLAAEQEPFDGTETETELAAFDAGVAIGVFMAATSYEIHSGQLLAEYLPGTFAAPSRTTLDDLELEAFAESAGIGPIVKARALVEWLVEHGWRRIAA